MAKTDESEEPPTDSQAIDLLILAWLNATAAGDPDALAGLVTPEARFFLPSGPPIEGPQGIAKLYRPIFERYDVVQTSQPDEISIVGDTAIVMSADRMEMIPRSGGDKVEMEGRAMLVLRCGIDGRWLFHRGINNMVPVGNMTDASG